MDGVKMALVGSGMTKGADRQCAKEKNLWRDLVNMLLIEYSCGHVC